MKMKLKFDKQSIQDFLLLNAEKIFCGAVVLATLLILYFSWKGVERFDRTPDNLHQTADRALAQIEQNKPDPAVTLEDYAKEADRSRVPIVVEPYVYPNLWDKPLFEVRTLRGDPPLLTVVELRGKAEQGMIRGLSSAAPEARPPRTAGTKSPRPVPPAPVGPRPEKKLGGSWVVLTGLVPVAQQETAYTKAFRDSAYYDPNRDVPSYLAYWVERVEVNSPAEAANPPWDKAQKFFCAMKWRRPRRSGRRSQPTSFLPIVSIGS